MAQMLGWIGSTEAMRRPSFAITVFAFVFLLAAIAPLSILCCDGGFDRVSNGGKWVVEFLDGKKWETTRAENDTPDATRQSVEAAAVAPHGAGTIATTATRTGQETGTL
jgi:hypothetical protein